MATLNQLLSQPVYHKTKFSQIAIPLILTGFIQYWQTTSNLGNKIDILAQKVDSLEEKNNIRSEAVDRLVDNKILLHEKLEERILQEVKTDISSVKSDIAEMKKYLINLNYPAKHSEVFPYPQWE